MGAPHAEPALQTSLFGPAASPPATPSVDHFDSFPQSPAPASSVGFVQPQAYLDADSRATLTIDGKPSFTIDEAASQLIRGEPGWSSGLGEPAVVTYAYRASAPATMPSDTTGFERFDQAQIDQAELALKAWSDVANITFVRVGAGDTGDGAYSDDASILLGDYTSGASGSAAFTYFPGSTASDSTDGDVWINSSYPYNSAPDQGNYGAHALVHELGHAMGLAHPSDYDAANGQAPSYSANASYYEDDRQYTVMSYFSEANTGANFGGHYPAAPMLDDIAAAQLEYGANMATRTGDTVYGFHSNADRPWFLATTGETKLVFAVWDAGGVNTFDFSGFSQDQLIDLRPGDFSNVGGLVGNVAIANGTAIQDAIGGTGDDVLWGNSANDVLNGGAGADTLNGGAGASVQLAGGQGDDSISGGAGFNSINGNQGQDTIVGGSTVGDWLLGGQGDDSISAHSGAHNLIFGNMGNDTLTAGSGGDTLRGGQDNDMVAGGAGADWLSGDMGHNTLTGGAGADTFHASPTGIDVVTDFNRAEGDQVLVDPGITWTAAQRGVDAVIQLASGGQVTLTGVNVASLTSGWIVTG